MESVQLYITIIEYRYDQNAYGTDDQIKKPSKKWFEIPLKVGEFQLANFEIQKEKLETDDKLYNFGMHSNDLTFQTISDLKIEGYKLSGFNPLALFVELKHSRNIIEHKRVIYGPLDLLGDVGGLSDALFPIGGILISLLHLITGNPFTAYLFTNIFE